MQKILDLVASISENEIFTDKWIVGLSESNALKFLKD